MKNLSDMDSGKMTSDQVSEQRLGACVYVLHMVLQRIEGLHPGTIKQMIASVASDRSGVRPNTHNKDQVQALFDEALSILSIADRQVNRR